MHDVIRKLASLKLAVGLLLALLVALAAGTIIESRQGAPAAQAAVYFSWWFIALQVALAVNVIASLVHLAPWGRQRLGFLLTHVGIVITLAGAVVTWQWGMNGSLGLWEGQSGNEVVEGDGSRTIATLPFTVKLDDFRIDYYQGTRRPSNFNSFVTVMWPDGRTEQARIFMNHPLRREGWTLYQSSYQQSGGREATILSVAKDPGQNVAFLGYAVLVLGMCIVLGTRIAQKRERARWEAEQAAQRTGAKNAAKAAAAALLVVAFAAPARASDVADAIRHLPVQHDGRVMPFDTAAREAVWNVTGRRAWQGQDPVETVAGWVFGGQSTWHQPVVAIERELARTAGLPGSHVSFAQAVENPTIRRLMEEASRAAQADQPRRGLHADVEKLEARLVWLQRVVAERDVLRALPASPDPSQQWRYPDPIATAEDLAQLASGPRLQGWPDAAKLALEVRYNHLRPARFAWVVLAGALVASLIAWRGRRRGLHAAATGGLVLGFAAMTWGIYARWISGERIPASNMYESLLFLGWGVGLFAVVALVFMRRNRLLVMNANAGAALTMALVDLLPMDSFIHPVPPVLAGTPWLAIHVPIIMVGYAVLALGLVIAHVQIGYQVLAPARAESARRSSELLYWYLHVGNILLVVGILTGSIWAADSWGRYWGWDPKEVWSLVAFLAYMVILHARWDRVIGSFGVAALSIVGFQTILMTYLGVNYVLGTGMHAYGFGDSPVLKWMIVTAVVEGGFLTWATLAYRRRVAGAVPATA